MRCERASVDGSPEVKNARRQRVEIAAYRSAYQEDAARLSLLAGNKIQRRRIHAVA
jgi:hypothetical protein